MLIITLIPILSKYKLTLIIRFNEGSLGLGFIYNIESLLIILGNYYKLNKLN